MTSLIPLMFSLYAFLAGGDAATNKTNTINAAIGDVSYTAKYGEPPTNRANETDRIKTHLAYVEQQLRSKDVSHLPAATKQRRAEAIALLHEYRTAGKFPGNYDHRGRRPCFIDKDGNICAVGYLVEQTAGRAVAEAINTKHQYDYIDDMNMPELTAWISTSGLTKEECAMIQPSYGYRNPPTATRASYIIATSVLTGANVALSAVNIRQSIVGKNSTAASVIGLATGSAQTVLGALNLGVGSTGRTGEETASKINIAVGGVTVVSSMLNILMDKKPKSGKTDVSLASFSTMNNEPVLGFTLTRRL